MPVSFLRHPDPGEEFWMDLVEFAELSEDDRQVVMQILTDAPDPTDANTFSNLLEAAERSDLVRLAVALLRYLLQRLNWDGGDFEPQAAVDAVLEAAPEEFTAHLEAHHQFFSEALAALELRDSDIKAAGLRVGLGRDLSSFSWEYLTAAAIGEAGVLSGLLPKVRLRIQSDEPRDVPLVIELDEVRVSELIRDLGRISDDLSALRRALDVGLPLAGPFVSPDPPA